MRLQLRPMLLVITQYVSMLADIYIFYPEQSSSIFLRNVGEPCARLMFLEQSLPRTCWLVSLRRDLLSPEFSDTIRLRSWVKGREGVASVYVMSGSVVLEHSWFGFSLLRSLGLDPLSWGSLGSPSRTGHHWERLVRESRWIHIVSPGATLESDGCYFGSWKTSMW